MLAESWNHNPHPKRFNICMRMELLLSLLDEDSLSTLFSSASVLPLTVLFSSFALYFLLLSLSTKINSWMFKWEKRKKKRKKKGRKSLSSFFAFRICLPLDSFPVSISHCMVHACAFTNCHLSLFSFLLYFPPKYTN